LVAVNVAVAESPGSLPMAATVLAPGAEAGITSTAVNAPADEVVMVAGLVITVPLV